ncbi:DNA polymerase III subunit beta [Sneathiella sp. P13V-1]|uniref:DNA polymerase III subunit beta n=1 Tax=Sneathiella sp. P13V-1 TaxID=2697366 RepID=UPI00187B5327|nr:DNA polymerase III subunit beta [Sneathiella sp. P13V-1]MBE7636036.1 DNA polymerase III subunit beta [Sneathiella sp. P13V-1]
MKLTIERSTLLTALNHVQSVVERRNTIPILSNILLNAENGSLGLTATDLDLAINEQAEADIQTPGAITAPAHLLYDIVRKLPDGSQIEIAYQGEEGRILVRAGRSQFALSCLPRDDFPIMETGELPFRFSVSTSELKRLIDKSRFAISTEETRYYLNGIYLHAADNEGIPVLRAVATDGHRLARVETPLPANAENIPGIIIPRKAVGELRKLIDDNEGDVAISMSDNRICFSFGGSVLTSKLIDGTFPDYERVIPSGNDKVLELDGRTFAQAVDRVSTISTEKSRAIKLALSGDTVTLSATGADSGSATEELAASYQSDSMEIGFNSKYLLDITGQIEGDNARFILADAQSPTIVRDGTDDGALYVLMPMRV